MEMEACPSLLGNERISPFHSLTHKAQMGAPLGDVQTLPRLSQSLLEICFSLCTGTAGLQGCGIFQHRTEADRSLWVGAAGEIGLRHSGLRGWKDIARRQCRD